MIDEFTSLQLKLDKKELSELLNYLYQIILEGRALGVFVVLGLQQANATVLPTALREQFSSIFRFREQRRTNEKCSISRESTKKSQNFL